ncbi:adenine-specific DNA-methyltransferase [Methylomarinovum tepidoasis]|uniref:site-specific DNA-methyltransferase (adenine-specific) n=1 Tax=Methylomarinovum tepidoasis TaxID=2840183 RepID=A0AAU9C469_9GAMM|nr:site-specific DNA-methyltransferase [Methylomarinovum sp. IN45]BCX88257.1 adenine-specific DNA-methyltransferase [Methylomarinovum sp. IN45]
MAKRTKKSIHKRIETFTHDEATRKNIPTAEYQSVVPEEVEKPKAVRYPRGVSGLEEEKANRNRDLDPQLVWRGKDEQDWSDLVVQAPPLYIQEKIHPKALIDDLMRRTEAREQSADPQPDLFADFNGIDNEAAKTEFYQHEAHWTNRLILGDSLQVMASLAEREGLRGKVQCIYLDPPYGIKFNSNFQWSTTSRDVKDGKPEHITREPEQVKAFRDTWRDGIHSYLTYLRDRLTVCRDLLTDSGSIFVQIGDENVHRVRALMDEVFGDENFIGEIAFAKTSSATSAYIPSIYDIVLWYARNQSSLKYRQLMREKSHQTQGAGEYMYTRRFPGDVFRLTKTDLSDEKKTNATLRIDNLTSQSGGETTRFRYEHQGRRFWPGSGGWKTNRVGMERLEKADRLYIRRTSLNYVRFLKDYPAIPLGNYWDDTAIAGWSEYKVYVVQTARRVIERCLLMTTDPGDLVLDPTCGSGTTAYVAEQWGRRWITIDTSRVALALARARIMGARYPYYLLADSPEGQRKEAEITRSAPSSKPTHGDIRHGFVYQRVPHITLKSIANNAEIDVIWERFEAQLKPLREELTRHLPDGWLADYRKRQQYDVEVPPEIQEWEIPREFPESWSEAARALHEQFWELRIARQKEIDASIAAKADFEYLYDKPYEDKSRVRVAGPFTVESLSPHRVLTVDENDELVDQTCEGRGAYGEEVGFVEMILDHLRTAGVQQAHKEDKIDFVSLVPWPGDLICAEGKYEDEAGKEVRAAIFVGPEFGTVSRPDLVEAAREAADAGFDVLIACAFSYDAQCGGLNKLGRLPILQARMNADLHMAADLKNTGKGNLFVIFGEPDIDILETGDGRIQVRINGVDVFHPQTGEVRSDGPEGIACWFIDTDYNQESFFVRHAYFLGAGDPYKALKTTLKAEIDEEAWASLNSNVSRPFPKPASGRIAVKVINHLGDEVMKVFRV